MTIPWADHIVARLRHALPSAAWALGDLETALMRSGGSSTEADDPIYVTGLARAGTTVLTEILAALPETATHRYADRALPHAPMLWRKVQRALQFPPTAEQERAHGDGLMVTRTSPEAAEEPIWRDAFGRRRVDLENLRLVQPFQRFYRNHLAKVRQLEGGHRYLAKNNELVGRLPAIHSLFQDPRVVIVVRDPIAQIGSLMRQHARFVSWAQSDRRIGAHLTALGHTEFGPARRAPIAASPAMARRIETNWEHGQEVAAWALAWSAVYQASLDYVRKCPKTVTFVRHTDLVEHPKATLERLFAWLGVRADTTDALEMGVNKLQSHRGHPAPLDYDARAIVQHETATLHERIRHLCL